MKALAWGLAFSAAFALVSPVWGQTAPGQYQSQPAYQQAPYQQGGQNPQQGPSAEQHLQAADRADTGRGLEWVWLEGDIGFQAASLQGFSGDLVDEALIDDAASGLAYGAAAGVRAIAFTAGARFRYGNFGPWDLWSLGLEGGFHIPLGNLEPFINLGAGYVSVGAFETGAITPTLHTDDLDIDGYNIRIGGGLDYYITPRFSVGALVQGDFTGLFRSAVPTGAAAPGGNAAQVRADALYRSEGSGLGWAFSASAVLGLHF